MFQASDMGTQKWSLLDNLPGSLQNAGDVEYLYGGVFKGAHELFKHPCFKTKKHRYWESYQTTKLSFAINRTLCELANAFVKMSAGCTL